MKPISPARATAMVTTLFLGGLFAGALTGVAAVARAQDPYAHLDLFARVLTTIEGHYVDEVSAEELVDAAIEGMVDHLDRQSRWLSADQVRTLEDETVGATTSLGVEIDAAEDGTVTITRVLPGSPALRDGLIPGDRILALDGEPVTGMELSTVRSAMQGPRGKGAVLTVVREGLEEPIEIRTRRDRIHLPSVERALVDQVAYLRLLQFQDGAAFELRQAFEALEEEAGGREALRGLVLDLRDNPGGLLTEAVAVADLFLDEGPIVSTRGRVGAGSGEEYRATPASLSTDLPMAILVNGMSASASEIVAAALQETGRATLVGERTYGKGTIQQVYRHEGQTALKLTVGRYYTPSGAPVADHQGRLPDRVVHPAVDPSPVDALRAAVADLDLPAEDRDRLDALIDRIPAPPAEPRPIPWDLPPGQRLEADPPLAAALALFSPP